ncbi:hypothetical protein H6F95_11600 [Cyanobacteria bacterium FACHB-471]|nr:hypothetical protein [Cyanobacteria bacterium FACHB-471]
MVRNDRPLMQSLKILLTVVLTCGISFRLIDLDLLTNATLDELKIPENEFTDVFVHNPSDRLQSVPQQQDKTLYQFKDNTLDISLYQTQKQRVKITPTLSFQSEAPECVLEALPPLTRRSRNTCATVQSNATRHRFNRFSLN